VLQLVLPRRYAFAPVIVAGCYMTLGQALLIAGLHFYLLRVLIVFGLIRVLLRGELSGLRPNGIDGVLIANLLVSTFLFVLFDGTNATLIGRLGAAYDAIGAYILVRASVRSVDDALAVVKACAVIVIPLAVPFIMEFVSGRNVFAPLGGLPLLSEIRNGRVRSQGPFRHPILAGTFGATAMPMFVGLLVSGKANRLLATLATISATIIVFTSGSSGPICAFALGTVGLLIWPCRKTMRSIRWGILLVLLGLAVVMKQPVWFLIARVSDLSGGGGWYRSGLIDAAVRHFDEWWLIGTGYTAHWMGTGSNEGSNSADIVNEFVFQGVNGGVLALFLFVWLIVKCFKTIGTTLRTPGYSSGTQFVIWSLGCGLVSHIASFFSVSYFDQIIIFWYLLIGLIVAVASQTKAVATLASSPNPTRIDNAGQRTRFDRFRTDPSRRHGFAQGRASWQTRGPR
jgi:hypothetical protein